MQGVLESELLRIWPFPPIVLGCRNSSKNMLHTELAAAWFTATIQRMQDTMAVIVR